MAFAYNTGTGVVSGTFKELYSNGYFNDQENTHTFTTGRSSNQSFSVTPTSRHPANDLYLYGIQLSGTGNTSAIPTYQGLFDSTQNLYVELRAGTSMSTVGSRVKLALLKSSNKNVDYSDVSLQDVNNNFSFSIGYHTVTDGTEVNGNPDSRSPEFTVSYSNLAAKLKYGHAVTLQSTPKVDGYEAGSLTITNGDVTASSSTNLKGTRILPQGANVTIKLTPKDGYMLDKWTYSGAPNETNNTVKTYYSTTFVPNVNYPDFTVSAQMRARTYSITYSNLGPYALTASHKPNFVYSQGNKGSFPLIALSKPGYTFGNWTNKDGEVVTQVQTNVASNQTFKANYSENTYNIRYVYYNPNDDSEQRNDYRLNLAPLTYKVSAQNSANLLWNWETLSEAEKEGVIPELNGYDFFGFYLNGKKITNFEDLPLTTQPTTEYTVITLHFSPSTKPVEVKSEITDKTSVYGTITPTVYDIQTNPSGEGATSKTEVLYSDGYDGVKISVSYDHDYYSLDGWYREGEQTPYSTEDETFIILSHLDKENTYTAKLTPKEYTINIVMTDYDTSEEKICGQVITDRGKIWEEGSRDGIKNMEIRYDLGIVKLRNLRYEDKISLAIVPYIKITPEGKYIYYFDRWSNNSSILDVEVKDWNGRTDIRYPVYFLPQSLDNTVDDEETDDEIAVQLIERDLTKFILKNKIEKLGDRCFFNCKNLKFVYMPGIREIGDNVFENCEQLSNITISSKSQGATGYLNAFKNCNNLVSLVVPGKYIKLNSPFGEDDGDESHRETWSNFARNLGRIYINPEEESRYRSMDENNTNWQIYQDVICPIEEITDSDGNIYTVYAEE